MKFGQEFELVVDGEAMRGIQAWGSEEELSRLVNVDAGKKGWSLHLRKQGEVILRKAYERAVVAHEAEPSAEQLEEQKREREQLKAEEERAEWAGGLERTESLPEGMVVCARCGYLDRTVTMHGMMRCGSPASRSSIAGRATFYGPFYLRRCNDYLAAPPK